jgi:large subunit ribosomal protein L32
MEPGEPPPPVNFGAAAKFNPSLPPGGNGYSVGNIPESLKVFPKGTQFLIIMDCFAYFPENPMAVPKKKTSKSKRDMRRANWRRKAAVEAQKAISRAKSILTGRAEGFVYPENEEDDED